MTIDSKHDFNTLLITKSMDKAETKKCVQPAIGAIGHISVERKEPKIVEVIVRNNRFMPENLKIEKGSIVEWRISEDTNDFIENSYYIPSQKSHVIAFNSLMIESPILRENDLFKLRFLESGHFTYKC